MEASEARSIPVADIQPCPLFEGLTATGTELGPVSRRLANDGLPKPLLVRPSPGKEGSKYELIWGEKWLAAAKQLGWATIPSRIETLSDQQALLAGLREAAGRGELTPVARARAYRRLREAPFNLSFKQIARELRLKDATSVRRFDHLLLQPQTILDLLSQGRLNEGHVRYLDRLPDLRRRVALAKRAARGTWSIARLRERVGSLPRRTGQRRPSGGGYDYNGFHLVRDGERILFSGRDFRFSRESPAAFASALQSALESFIQNHMAEEMAAALKEIEKAIASSPAVANSPSPASSAAGQKRGVDPLAVIKGLEELNKKFGNLK